MTPAYFQKEKLHKQYGGGTIYCDSASNLVYIRNQISLAGGETVKGKRAFELMARHGGVSVRNYLGDNGVFAKQLWKEHCELENQTHNYCGVGAHHQNGKSERTIRTIVNMARSMLLHAMIHWPDETSLDLWPFAMKYAAYLWNKTPNKFSGLSPEEIFYRTKAEKSDLKHMKVFGCPTFVLEPKLQDKQKIPKWLPRSRMGQILGFFNRSRFYRPNDPQPIYRKSQFPISCCI